jgi:hypothetical protein
MDTRQRSLKRRRTWAEPVGAVRVRPAGSGGRASLPTSPAVQSCAAATRHRLTTTRWFGRNRWGAAGHSSQPLGTRYRLALHVRQSHIVSKCLQYIYKCPFLLSTYIDIHSKYMGKRDRQRGYVSHSDNRTQKAGPSRKPTASDPAFRAFFRGRLRRSEEHRARAHNGRYGAPASVQVLV